MIEKTVILSNFSKMKNFVSLAASLPYKVELVGGKKRVDAEVMAQVMTLDLTRPLVAIAHTDSAAAFTRAVAEFLYKD